MSVPISGLPPATALSGAEPLPLVQGGETRAATVAQIRAGLAPTAHSHVPADVSGILTQGKQTIWVPAGAMTARNTNGAASGSVESTTNKLMRVTRDFDAATQEYAQFCIAMPKSWNEGTVTFQALWTAASGSGGVAFALQGVALSDLDNLDAAFGTAQVVTDTLGTAAYLHQTAESAAITIGGSPAENDMVAFQIYREVANAADTLAVDALLLGVRLFYTVNAGNDA